LVIALVLVAALAVRILSALRADVIEHDGALYAGFARAILEGDWANGISTIWPPGFPVLIAAATSLPMVFGHSLNPPLLEASARGVSIVCGMLALIPLYSLARRTAGRRVADATLLIAAFHPRLIQYSAAALTEMPYTLFLLGGVATFAARSGPARRPWMDATAGALFGLAYLIRPEGLPLALALWIFGTVASRGSGRGLLRTRPLFLGVLLLTAAPYLIHVHGRLGHWSLGEKGSYNFWREFRREYASLYPEPTVLSERVAESPELNQKATPEHVEVLGFVTHRPGAFLARSARNLAVLLGSSLPSVVYYPFLALAVLGVVGRRLGRSWPALIPIFVLVLLYAPFSVDRRFLVPAVPFVLIFSARGIRVLGAWWGRRTRRLGHETFGRRVPPLATAAAAAGFLYSAIHGLSIDRAPEHRKAGEWLGRHWAQSHEPPGKHERPIVVSRKPWVAFYSGGLIAELPEGSVDDVLERARRKNADVLVVDERWIVTNRPALAPLLDPANAPARLQLLYRDKEPPPIVLYEVRGPSR